LVRDRGSSAHRFPFPLRFFHREFHLLPVKALVLEESLIFRYPEVLQEHLWHLRQIDPAVAERRLRRAREHRAALVNQHRHRQRRIDESHHRHLHRRGKKQSHEQNQNPFFPETTSGGAFYAAFLWSRLWHLRQETAMATRAQPVVMPRHPAAANASLA
jgi:hypothetical protein